MTLAICTVCGAEKFGAFVPCEKCEATPTTVGEKAKSITLSDHSFPPAELRKFSEMLRAGTPIPYDPVGLAGSAGDIIAYDYYWHHMSAGGDELPCMRCGRRFHTDEVDELCPACRAVADQPVLFCPKCVAIYDQEARFCPKCGNAISRSHSNAKSVAFSLMLGVERLSDPSIPLRRFEAVTGAHDRLTAAERARCMEEIRWLAIYATSTILRENAHSDYSVGMNIYRDMTELYSMSLAFRSIDHEVAGRWSDECTVRFEEYDRTVNDFVRDAEHDPQKWFLGLAAAAEKHCYPTIKEGTAVWQLVLDIGYFVKVQRDILGSILAKAATH